MAFKSAYIRPQVAGITLSSVSISVCLTDSVCVCVCVGYKDTTGWRGEGAERRDEQRVSARF